MLLPWRILCLVGAFVGCLPAVASAFELRASPERVRLAAPEASQQILVALVGGTPASLDVTRQSTFEIVPATLASITPAGLIRPQSEGQGEIVVRHDGQELRLPLTVEGLVTPPPVSFRHEVLSVLSKSRCNSGGCHGKAEGQNGFKLSVFGFDAASDHEALVKQGRGRRVFPADPDASLLLQKGSATLPHGGGLKFATDSFGYRRVRRWIAEGARLDVPDESLVVRIEIEPAEQVLLPGGSQQLRVTAIDDRGERRCVTAEAEFESNAANIAAVDTAGLIAASQTPGEAAVLVRFLGHVAAARVTVPQPDVQFERPAENNFIDGLVWDRLARLGIKPSDLADDATFLRRVYLDTIGILPTVTEVREFLADTSPDKRAKLIDRLLERDEYADYWAMRWGTILRNDRVKVTPQAAYGMHRWLRRQFVENRPYDEFVSEILTSRGHLQAESPAAFYKALATPEEASRAVSQLFLGVRIECAQCHHHPSERWSQDDYFALAGFFTGMAPKPLPGGGESLNLKPGTDLNHPRTGKPVPTSALGAESSELPADADRRAALAAWMVQPDNPFFARIIVNRLWAHYLGRGLVEPLDDLRDTNPASNEPLMRALEAHLREADFDLKAFTRTLLNSRVYQLSATTNPTNEADQQNFSHALYKALPAEVLLDSVCQSTGIGEKFNGWPAGYRAVQVWDNRMPSYFFKIFGRPVRTTVCECERSDDPSITQALHLLNSPEIDEKIAHRHGVARRLADSAASESEILDELYLGTLARYPTDQERQTMLAAMTGVDRRVAIEDALWTLLNLKEYLYNH